MVHTTIKSKKTSPPTPIKNLNSPSRLTIIFIEIAQNQAHLSNIIAQNHAHFSNIIESMKKKIKSNDKKIQQLQELTEDMATDIKNNKKNELF
jgi:hypothetical protein